GGAFWRGMLASRRSSRSRACRDSSTSSRFGASSRNTCAPAWRSAVVLRVEALRERLAKLEEVIARLGEVAAVTRDDFTRDFRRQWLAERGLELAAQAVLDIRNHSLAREF